MIYTDVPEITAFNVVDVLKKAMETHRKNRDEIDYLYRYRKGEQPIWTREKNVRPEIKNIIIENRADEIVSFKTGYQAGEPLQYVCVNSDEGTSDDFRLFNQCMMSADKAAEDLRLFEWLFTCGTAYRMILPNPYFDEDRPPFEIYTLDPRDSFVVYSGMLGKKPMMGVNYITREDSTNVYSCYTDRMYFKVVGDKLEVAEYHAMGDINIIEYPHGETRLGAFEIVIPMLDAINNVASNRLDAIEQFVQAIMVFKNLKVRKDDLKDLKDEGAIEVEGDGDVKYMVQELNQMQTQTLVDYMYQTVLTICGMPNRNGGSSTSDTGSAVIMRDGWEAAEARAKLVEPIFKKSERVFLRLATRFANILMDIRVRASDIDTRFTRRNYENILEKAQVLNTMLANPKIHPKLAFEHSGMFIDPEVAYAMSDEYYRQAQKEAAEAQMKAQAAQMDSEGGFSTDESGNDQ